MSKIDNHITEMTNGNSKRLAYYIFAGVFVLVSQFFLEVVDRVIAINKVTPTEVYEQAKIISSNQDIQINLLHQLATEESNSRQTILMNQMVTTMALIDQTQGLILDKANKMKNP